MCTSSIASTNGLRFVPVAHEDYELVVRQELLDDKRIRTLTSIIRSPRFRAVLQTIGGYDTSLTGTIRELNGEKALIPCSSGTLPAGYL